MFGAYLAGRLVLSQSLECGLPHIPIGGPAGKLDLGHKLRFYPIPIDLFARCPLATKGATIGPQLIVSA
jgi:hypothetical protein